jgi:hypothetical protein
VPPSRRRRRDGERPSAFDPVEVRAAAVRAADGIEDRSADEKEEVVNADEGTGKEGPRTPTEGRQEGRREPVATTNMIGATSGPASRSR